MVDVCDMSNFPPQPYFDQYVIPEEIPANYDYEYTRLFYIWAEATVNSSSEIQTITTSIREDTFTSQIPGTPKNVQAWESIAENSLQSLPAVPPTPFDFAVWTESRVILLLSQPFWVFSPNMAALTTKYDYEGHYFDLRRHEVIGGNFINVPDAIWQRDWSGQPSRCISFYTKDPCRDWQLPGGSPKVTHGFSLNLEVPMADGKRLPITVDPDIENKGGHN